MAEGKLNKVSFTELLQKNLNLSYQYLSTLFSSSEGITIEKYIILQKIEKVKELIVYDELSLSEIAYRLDYSSVQHLSNQFKKITGLTLSHFKKIKNVKRNPLDKVI
jgi:AraC-like DNA-binding protein